MLGLEERVVENEIAIHAGANGEVLCADLGLCAGVGSIEDAKDHFRAFNKRAAAHWQAASRDEIDSRARHSYKSSADFLFFLFPSETSPEGLWQRTGDTFTGCVLRVEHVGTELAGRIAVLPDAMAKAGWQVGDLKWRNITRTAEGAWRMQDLRKHYDTRKASVLMVDYQEYTLTLGACGHLRLHTGGSPFFPAQRWVRFS